MALLRLATECPSHGTGPVAEHGDGPLDPLSRLGGDVGAVVHDPGHRLRRHSAVRRHVLDGDSVVRLHHPRFSVG